MTNTWATIKNWYQMDIKKCKNYDQSLKKKRLFVINLMSGSKYTVVINFIITSIEPNIIFRLIEKESNVCNKKYIIIVSPKKSKHIIII